MNGVLLHSIFIYLLGFYKLTTCYFRYEFQNKGADVFLESMARLNYLLKVNIFSCLLYEMDIQFSDVHTHESLFLLQFWKDLIGCDISNRIMKECCLPLVCM